MSYSQNGEDLIIVEYFGEYKGHLLSIGENDGETFSNARLLIDNGWSAVLIEPSLAFRKLTLMYLGHNSVRVLGMGISDTTGLQTWYELPDSLLSTTKKELAESWGREYETTEAYFTRYETVADNYDFITIDAEGSDWIILQQIDLSHTKCLCIEYGKHETDITDYCEMFHMKLLHKNGENLIFVK